MRTGRPARALAAVAFTVLTAAACRTRPAIDPLPGAQAYDASLRRQLADALARRGPHYVPRTRHRRPDGAPRWTNRLILESSPYLLQHAHNPVDWYPWGEEAFARARAGSKPVLLSVGYSTCHWCHVMEEESFEDEEVAAYLNAHYVAIKVDREERPDVDTAYMTAVQLISGRGGWPMTVWLTPVREPFFGGTYFPPRDGERGVRVGFLTLLRQLHDAFEANPLRVAQQATAIAARVRQLSAPPPGDTLPDARALNAAFATYRARFDAAHGGFGDAPKFPSPAALGFLLRYQRRTGSAAARDMVVRTLERMAAGGIHDQLGGGFHRYATDAAWRVPHFEKMLYDNAQLAVVYLDAAQAAGRPDFAVVARDVLDYLAREMSAPGGGFYAATDADSEGVEGKFFLWTPDQIRAALPPDQADAALAYWDVTPAGNLEGGSILATPRPLDNVASALDTTPAALQRLVDAARPALYAARAARVPPHTDTKVLAAWNGLAISAFARAGAALGEARYVERARVAAGFVLDRMRADGRLARSFADGGAHGEAFLDDYACMAAGLLDLHQATLEPRWLDEALALHDVLAREFWDDAGGGFFSTGTRHEVTLAREKPDEDGVVPSGNAVAAETLLRLAELTGDDRHRARAEAIIRALAGSVVRTPTGASRLLGALDFLLDRPKEIVIVRPRPADPDADTLLATVRRTFLPNHVLAAATEGAELEARARRIPLLADKQALRGRATAYVCEARVCAAPTGDPFVLAAQLATVHPLPGSDGG